jgi:hypothetical protein
LEDQEIKKSISEKVSMRKGTFFSSCASEKEINNVKEWMGDEKIEVLNGVKSLNILRKRGIFMINTI